MIESEAENVESVVGERDDTFVEFENVLRPKALGDYIGQENIKSNLGIAMEAAKKRGDVLDHVLLHGAPGLGKTTLASIIAREFGVGIKVTSGPALEKQGDVASIISNLEEGDILFIDEIHRLKTPVEEILYTAMEDFGIDIIIGKGPAARNMRLSLPKFTLIGATTKMSMISAPMRSRFGNVFRLQFYSEIEMAQIVLRSAKLLNCNLDESAATALANSSRSTPRVANRLLKRVRDYAEVKGIDLVTDRLVVEALSAMGVDNFGLEQADRDILSIIIEKFRGGPVGLSTLAAATSEEKETLENIYEPFMIQLGLLERTARGRSVTRRAYEHLGFQFKAK